MANVELEASTTFVIESGRVFSSFLAFFSCLLDLRDFLGAILDLLLIAIKNRTCVLHGGESNRFYRPLVALYANC